MHQWHCRTTLITRPFVTIVLLQWLLLASVWAGECSSDLNHDGEIDGAGETASCMTTTTGEICPINAVNCTRIGNNYSCPLGSPYSCHNVKNVMQCATSPCIAVASTEVTTTSVNSNIYIEDGNRDAQGNCTDITLIFSGRAMECKPSGKSTGFKNCCKSSGSEIYFDSKGSAVETTLTSKALTTTYKAATAAYGAYSSAIKAGQTAQQATQAAQTSATNVFSTAFDPTSLAISIAVAVLMEYFAQACDQPDMETAMLNSSGYCIYLGEYCKERWPVGGCVQKAKSFCCFNSKLAKLIHEQGRPQLTSIGSFGSVENPNCRGFTPEEFQSLDFSQIDLSSYYAELTTASQADIQQKVTVGVNEFFQKTGH